MEHPETLAAWAAGFFDGEGSLTIYVLQRKNRPSSTHEIRIMAQVSQSKRYPLDVLAKCYGGHVLGPYLNKGGRRRHYRWALTNTRLANFLQNIQPFARVKGVEIDIALAALAMQRRRGESGARIGSPDGKWKNEVFYGPEKIAQFRMLRERLIAENSGG